MSNFNDKSDTFEFDPIKDNKPRVNRGGSDPYSNARQNTVREDDGDGPNYTLVYVALILAILLIVVVIAGILIMGRAPEKKPSPQQQEEILVDNDSEEEYKQDEDEDVDITLLCTVTFYSDSVIKQGEKYTVHADLYDGELYKFGSRKLTVSDETDIREKGGKKVSKEEFISLIENMAGESLAFSAEIREKDNLVLSVSFDGSIVQENPPEEEPPTEEEPPAEEEPSDEDGEIILPGEEPETQLPEGI